MIKKTVISLGCFFSIGIFAGCPQSAPTNSPDFCSSFKTAAECYCESKGFPRKICDDMPRLYNQMVNMFGSLRKACEFQRDTSPHECITDWSCYVAGRTDVNGEPCNDTGHACES